jgi:Ni/Co efflux regulator RcnB
MKAVQKFKLVFAVIATTLGLSATAHAAEDGCFTDLDELRAYVHQHNGVKAVDEWKDNDDGSMRLSLDDAGNAILLTVKESGGIWANGRIKLCPSGPGNFIVKPFAGHLNPGDRLPSSYRSFIMDSNTAISIQIKDSTNIDVRVAKGLAKHFKFKADSDN